MLPQQIQRLAYTHNLAGINGLESFLLDNLSLAVTNCATTLPGVYTPNVPFSITWFPLISAASGELMTPAQTASTIGLVTRVGTSKQETNIHSPGSSVAYDSSLSPFHEVRCLDRIIFQDLIERAA